VGRKPMDERLGFLVSSLEHLAEKLRAFVAGERAVEDVYQGQAKRARESLSLIADDDDLKEAIVDKWIARRRLSKLAELWIKGLDVQWTKLYGLVKPHRISLPTYPFARDRYWIEHASDPAIAGGATPTVLHPLLHRNTSDLSEQRYTSTFTGDEVFLTEDPIDGRRMLLATATLEMARA